MRVTRLLILYQRKSLSDLLNQEIKDSEEWLNIVKALRKADMPAQFYELLADIIQRDCPKAKEEILCYENLLLQRLNLS